MRDTAGMFPILTQALSYLSRVCGFETVDAFPPGHVHARTHWNPAYFDIASDLKPDQIERTLCDKISNTPAIFAHISNPTPGMQRTLLAIIETRMRRAAGGSPVELIVLLVNAFRSPYTIEALPGLRSVIEDHDGDPRAVAAFLDAMPDAYDVIDADTGALPPAPVRRPMRLLN